MTVPSNEELMPSNTISLHPAVGESDLSDLGTPGSEGAIAGGTTPVFGP